MIKAEVISHEGNPGPNWLDRCRTAITPANITVLLLVIVSGAVFVGITQNDKTETANQLPANSNSNSEQPNLPAANSLQVQPLTEETTTNNGNPNIQSAAGGTSPTAAPTAQNNSADALGAARTPALNSSNQNNKQPQSPVNWNQLNSQLQSTLQNTQNKVNKTVDDVNKAVNNLTGGLGL
ncbi:MAG TPA: hypothetical protein VGE30_02495 [Candidatus Saccharimonadales bacterium]